MNAHSAGIKLAATLDQSLVGASKIASTVNDTAQSFWSAFTGELERRRRERAAHQPALPVTPF
jgi:hypothetical protein